MKPRWRGTAAACLLACAPLAQAGSVEGPYVVWVNLGGAAQAQVDGAIRDFVNGSDRPCWPDTALLFMRQRPPAVTPALVRRALVRRQADAQRELRQVLRQPFDDVPGFDGVVAYQHGQPARLLSLATTGRMRAATVQSRSGEPAWGAAFCTVLPPIGRKP